MKRKIDGPGRREGEGGRERERKGRKRKVGGKGRNSMKNHGSADEN